MTTDSSKGTGTERCRLCLHDRKRHEIEPPYPCYDCGCDGFSYSAASPATPNSQERCRHETFKHATATGWACNDCGAPFLPNGELATATSAEPKKAKCWSYTRMPDQGITIPCRGEEDCPLGQMEDEDHSLHYHAEEKATPAQTPAPPQAKLWKSPEGKLYIESAALNIIRSRIGARKHEEQTMSATAQVASETAQTAEQRLTTAINYQLADLRAKWNAAESRTQELQRQLDQAAKTEELIRKQYTDYVERNGDDIVEIRRQWSEDHAKAEVELDMAKLTAEQISGQWLRTQAELEKAEAKLVARAALSAPTKEKR